MAFRSSPSSRLAVRVVVAVVFLLLCGYALSSAEGARPLQGHGSDRAGFSAANLPLFVVARAGPSRRGAGH
ncbi:hypothetical protein BS78_04G066700 [Paspalum vaginatum]|nr:hypothetical protein BS78_04G066700 [Paspalum vaginatum]